MVKDLSPEVLTKTAWQARKAFEQRTIPREVLRELFLAPNPDFLDVDNYLDFAATIFPRGNCGLTSVYLRHVIGAGQIVEGQYVSEQHTFLKVGALAVDITADQFGGPPIYVGPITLPWIEPVPNGVN